MKHLKYLLMAALLAFCLTAMTPAPDYLDGSILVEQDIGPPEIVAELTGEHCLQAIPAMSITINSYGMISRPGSVLVTESESVRSSPTIRGHRVDAGLLMRTDEITATARNGVHAG